MTAGSSISPRDSRSRSPDRVNVTYSIEVKDSKQNRQDSSKRHRTKPEVDDMVQLLVLQEAYKMSKMQLFMSYASVLQKFNHKQIFDEMKEQMKDTFDQLARQAI